MTCSKKVIDWKDFAWD